MIHGHGGNIFALANTLGCAIEDIVDMSSNINPLGAMPGLLAHLQNCLPRIQSLPEVDAAGTAKSLAQLLNLDPASILPGSGTTQFIYSACSALGTRKALIVGPSYADYADACRMHGIRPDFFLTLAADDFRLDLEELSAQLFAYDTLFLCAPNNPTGFLPSLKDLTALCKAHPQVRCIIDLSYLPFAEPVLKDSLRSLQAENIFILWSASKIFAIPGLRTGFLLASPEQLGPFRALAQPWSVNTLSQEAMHYLGKHQKEVEEYGAATRAYIDREMDFLRQDLPSELTIFPSATSYLLMQLPAPWQAKDICRLLQKERILIRDCSNFYGLDARFIRIALKNNTANVALAKTLTAILRHQGPLP